ncbi:hypothetical protein GKQ77_25345 [Streptomyces sp. BG9H]|uniref:L,D-transpeptidase n=1 Tax=Streptomyces anatolicus TaxID=2675858 RepID=A0ABS6YU16_9ACTN|nr:hypothetical protein [Streptomyces anatolicus]
MASRIPSWASVSGLTVSALAVVAVLAIQAEGVTPEPTGQKKPSASSSTPGPSGEKRDKAEALPKESGAGKRVVYSLRQDRIWLVDGSGDERVKTYTVWPGSVDPSAGEHKVTGLRNATVGSDGVQVVRVVYFSGSGGTSAAFSAARDGASPEPATRKKTGAIRLGSDASKSLWGFAKLGTSVVVVR